LAEKVKREKAKGRNRRVAGEGVEGVEKAHCSKEVGVGVGGVEGLEGKAGAEGKVGASVEGKAGAGGKAGVAGAGGKAVAGKAAAGVAGGKAVTGKAVAGVPGGKAVAGVAGNRVGQVAEGGASLEGDASLEAGARAKVVMQDERLAQMDTSGVTTMACLLHCFLITSILP